MRIIDIARIAHEVNKAYCESRGDTTQLSWEQAPVWQKQSAENGVRLHLENPNLGPEASHNSWMKEKIDLGWVHGDIKDAEAKTHPCIVPFDELPKEQQAKDFLFKAVCNSLSIHLTSWA
jgi:hypothetical protein